MSGFRVGGVAFSSEPAEALLRRPDGRTAHLPVLSVTDEDVLLLGWPVPRDLPAGATYPAVLVLGGERVSGLQFELTGAQTIFAGGPGRILRAAVAAGRSGLSRVVVNLVQAPDRRAEAG